VKSLMIVTCVIIFILHLASFCESAAINIALFGLSSVGKTCISYALANQPFVENHATTIGSSFMIATVQDNNADGSTTKHLIHIWDTAGEERYRSLIPIYTRQARIVLLVYDVTNPRSITDLHRLCTDFKSYLNDGKKTHIFVGNKVDLQEETLPNSTIDLLTAVYDDAPHVLVSAKTGEGMADLVKEICKMCAGAKSLHLPRRSSLVSIYPRTPSETNQQKPSNCCT
jgi:small GTP-binding protein